MANGSSIGDVIKTAILSSSGSGIKVGASVVQPVLFFIFMIIFIPYLISSLSLPVFIIVSMIFVAIIFGGGRKR